MHREQIEEALVGLLTSYLGATLARSSVQVHCEKLGINDQETVSGEQIEALIERLGVGLNIFVGREKSAQLVDRMRRFIAA